MNELCLTTDLASGDLAAWVQAVGTIVAVIATAGIAVWQMRQQHHSAMALHKAEQRHARTELARTLLTLCRNCTAAAKHFAQEMNTRDAVHKIAAGETHFDFEELQALQAATSSIPLHSLPADLVSSSMALAATVRQFRQTVEMAIKLHRQMDAAQFEELFRTIREITKSLELTCGDIEIALAVVQEDA